MAYRIDKEIVHGWIDNTIRGKVTGEIYIQGEKAPIRLDLEGDCHRDLAGSRCEFKNHSPEHNKHFSLNHIQVGKVGDMTASRRCRVPDIPFIEFYEQRKKGLTPPEHWANVLYLEWFSEKNGRVVIELPDIGIDVTLPVWKMTKEEERKQLQKNMDNMTTFLDQLVEAAKPPRAPQIDDSMDEFEWELLLQDSDAKGKKYGELLDKYKDYPNSEEIIHKQMGWNFYANNNAAESFNDEEWDDDDFTDFLEREEHPLVKRMEELGLTLHRHVETTPYHNSEEPVAQLIGDLIFNIHFATAKTASVLAYDELFDNGMIIAKLKRAITGIHKALNLTGDDKVAKALPKIIEPTKAELFAIREKMLKIMNQLREE